MILVVPVFLFLATSCARAPQKIDPNAYAKEIEQWRAKRLADLTSDDGWLTLVGLFWLKEGENKFGSDVANDVILPPGKVPPHAGSFSLHNGVVKLEAPPASGITADGKPATSLELKSDADGSPTVLHIGSVSLQVIKRGEKLGVRAKDKDNPDRTNFRGIDSYPADLNWRIDAKFEPYNPPKPMQIMNVLGMASGETSPGAIVFTVDGQTYRLDALTEPDEPRYFMIIADKTNGKETYGAGRYLYVDPADAGGHVVIDFNKAYSPPCAFTNFATCPLPPEQNRLPFAIEAGEKYSGHPRKDTNQAAPIVN